MNVELTPRMLAAGLEGYEPVDLSAASTTLLWDALKVALAERWANAAYQLGYVIAEKRALEVVREIVA